MGYLVFSIEQIATLSPFVGLANVITSLPCNSSASLEHDDTPSSIQANIRHNHVILNFIIILIGLN